MANKKVTIEVVSLSQIDNVIGNVVVNASLHITLFLSFYHGSDSHILNFKFTLKTFFCRKQASAK